MAALIMLRAEPARLLITDMQMPCLDGQQTLTVLHREFPSSSYRDVRPIPVGLGLTSEMALQLGARSAGQALRSRRPARPGPRSGRGNLERCPRMADPSPSIPVPGPDQHVPRIPSGRRRFGTYEALWAIGWVLIAAIAAFQVYDVFRRRDIVIETAEHRFASLARALAEQTALSIQLVDVVMRETVKDQELDGLRHRERSSVGQSNLDRELRQRLRNRILTVPQLRSLLVVGAEEKSLRPLTGLCPTGVTSRSALLRCASEQYRIRAPTLRTLPRPRRRALDFGTQPPYRWPWGAVSGRSCGLCQSRLFPAILRYRRSRSGLQRQSVLARWHAAGPPSRQRRRHRSILRRRTSISRSADSDRWRDPDFARLRQWRRSDPRHSGWQAFRSCSTSKWTGPRCLHPGTFRHSTALCAPR